MDSLNLKYLKHIRLGHARDTRISRLEKNGLIGHCKPYILGKMASSSFDGCVKRATKMLVLVHTKFMGYLIKLKGKDFSIL